MVKRVKAGASLLVLTLLLGGAAPEDDDRLAVQRARRLVKTHMRAMDVPGISVAVAKDGRVLWSEGFGVSDLETRTPVTPGTRFRIASVSKPLTATGALLLAEDGALDLDASVTDYLPGLPERYSGVTARQLAGHLAGVRHYRREGPVSSHRVERVSESLDLFVHDSLLFRPGTEYRYSTYGYVLLSVVMESAAGSSFLDYMTERVFEPAGMRRTGPAYLDSIIPERSRFYTAGQDGRRINAPRTDLSYKWAGGGFLSTAEDLTRFGSALLDGDLLGRASREAMWRGQRTGSGEVTGYGMGWRILESFDGRKVIYHGGNLPGARAHLALVPDEGIALAVLANTGTSIAFNDEETLALLDLFLRPDGPPSDRTADVTGAWTFEATLLGEETDGRIHVFRRDGDLAASLTLSRLSRPSPVPVVRVRGDTLRLTVLGGSWLGLSLLPPPGPGQEGAGRLRFPIDAAGEPVRNLRRVRWEGEDDPR